jgi:hypothetical protein
VAGLQDHSVPLPMGHSDKGWHIARQDLNIDLDFQDWGAA